VRAARWLLIVLLVPASACTGTHRSTSQLAKATVRASDLPPPAWKAFAAPPPSDPARICGRDVAVFGIFVPGAIEAARTAWARDPTNGPIFGERIERYQKGMATKWLAQTAQGSPSCEWTEAGTHWRASVEAPPTVGIEGRITLITNLDRPDSYNYEVAVRSGDVLLRAALNVRRPDRPLLDDLLKRAWRRAQTAHAVAA